MILYRSLLLSLCAAVATVATPALARPHTIGGAAPTRSFDFNAQALARSHEGASLAWNDRPRDQDLRRVPRVSAPLLALRVRRSQ